MESHRSEEGKKNFPGNIAEGQHAEEEKRDFQVIIPLF
jgi:hypothetical protein